MKALGIVTERRGKNSRYGSVRHEIHRWAGPKPSLRCTPLRNLSTTHWHSATVLADHAARRLLVYRTHFLTIGVKPYHQQQHPESHHQSLSPLETKHISIPLH